VTVSGDSKVVGTVTFSQESVAGPVTISGHIEGLDANAKRGFHIQCVSCLPIPKRYYKLNVLLSNLGDLSGGCVSAGPHFNPLGLTHGAREDTVRHKGDLGNIDSDDKGVANFEFTDSGISLNGPFTVIGRAVMVHAVRRPGLACSHPSNSATGHR
jgi:Cu-Zn family superoxide dismutase